METWTEDPREVHRGPVFSVLSGTARLDDGRIVTREIVHHSGSVAIVATAGDKVLLTCQSRLAAGGEEILEIPAGRIDVKNNETAEQAARRELEEETKYRGRLERGPVYYSSVGFLDEKIHIFFALDVEEIPESELSAKPDDDEEIELRWTSLAKVADDLKNYRLNDSKTIIGLRELLAIHRLKDQTF